MNSVWFLPRSRDRGEADRAIRVGGLRRGLWVQTYESDFGQYRQELAETGSALHVFAPSAILLALDAYHLVASVTAAMDVRDADAARAEVLAREAFRCPIIQQTPLPVHLPLLGSNEHRLPGSRAQFITRLNAALREMAEAEGVDLLALDDRAARDGIARVHDATLWHRSKQEIAPTAAPLYGDLVGRTARRQAGAIVQMPGAGPGQHGLGRRDRR